MVAFHFLDNDDWQFTAEERRLIVDVASQAEPDIRSHLPDLARRLNLLVEPGHNVIDVTGDLGYALSPHVVRWTVDPGRGVAGVAAHHLRHSLFHECHHATRLARYPDEAYTRDWRGGAVFEGLAAAFERDSGGFDPPWGQYDAAVIGEWAAELFRQPVDESYGQWKFQHPDGRRWIAYRVGTWVVDRATERSGRSPADLVWVPAEEIFELAELDVA